MGNTVIRYCKNIVEVSGTIYWIGSGMPEIITHTTPHTTPTPCTTHTEKREAD